MQYVRDETKDDDMVHRKGERPVENQVVDYSPNHPVASAIADGDQWMDAWLGQFCTPWDAITKKTGISRARIKELNAEADPTDDEIEKLAALWWTTPAGLRRSIEEAKAA